MLSPAREGTLEFDDDFEIILRRRNGKVILKGITHHLNINVRFEPSIHAMRAGETLLWPLEVSGTVSACDVRVNEVGGDIEVLYKLIVPKEKQSAIDGDDAE